MQHQLSRRSALLETILGTALLALGVSALGADFSIPSSYTSWDNENWVLSTNELIQGQYQSRAALANGYIGCGVAAAGPFFEADVNFTSPNGGSLPINGWPLDNPRQTFCTVSGFFNAQANTTRTNFPENLARGAESVIAGIPNWPNLLLQVGNTVLDATVQNATISNFTSTRSLKNGLQTWQYTWSPVGNISFDISYEMLVHRSRPNLGLVRLTVTSRSSLNVTIVDLLDGRGAVRSESRGGGLGNETNTIYTSVSPHWLPDVEAWIYSTVIGNNIISGSRKNASEEFYLPSNGSTVAQQFSASLVANEAAEFVKYVGIASSDGFEDPRLTANNASLQASNMTFEALFDESAAAWQIILDEDLVDDYSLPDGSLPEDSNVQQIQIVSKANAHYLLQNTLPSSLENLAKWSISVGGLTSDSYAGLVFWDADLFMSPGISASHPQYSFQIADYRSQLFGQAQRNAESYGYSQGSATYPWTSGRFGNCTGTGPCVDYQYHLNNDIFLNNILYWTVTGDDQWFKDAAIPINGAVLQMYAQLLKYNSTVGGYSIANLTDPDEYANQVPDGAYTLASIAKDIELLESYAQQFNLTIPANYSAIAADIALPFAPSGVLSEYRGANNSAVIKQDDVDLINYPLDYSSANYTEADRLTSLNYYSNLQSPDGPAMTYSLYSVSANSLSPSGCSAYTYSLAGSQPYVRAPWYQFSEQQVDAFADNGGTNPAFPFLTGAGGWHQIGPMGWLGARFTDSQLILQPALPPQIPFVSLRTIIFAGTGIKATMNYTHTNLTRVDVTKYLPANATEHYASQPFPFSVGLDFSTGTNYTIAPNQTLTISNRLYTSNVTDAGNILQCLSATSVSATQPGQFPLAAIDGAASTRWQPATSNATSMTIDTSSVPAALLSGVSFDWGARPPRSFRLVLSNGTTGSGNASTSQTALTVVTSTSVNISAPYDAASAAVIRPYTGNMSFYAFSQAVYSGTTVTLAVEGNAAGDALGATVGEVALYKAGDGTSLLAVAQQGGVQDGAGGSVTVQTVGVESMSGVPGTVAVQGLNGTAAGGNAGSGGGSSNDALRASGHGVWAVLIGGAVVALLLH